MIGVRPHNASAVYHNILLRDLRDLMHAMPEDHVFRDTVLDAVTRGLDCAAEETLQRGFTGTWTESFAPRLAMDRQTGKMACWAQYEFERQRQSGCTKLRVPPCSVYSEVSMRASMGVLDNSRGSRPR
ncbi:MAG: hypothetical protein ACK57G_04185 [Planctomycetota bacterium]|jgi:hypothetical protein